jgi:phosphatidylglycerophosphate synthase
MQGDLPCYLIWRPISFPVATLFLNLGIPVLAVTATSGLIEISMLLVAIFGGPGAWVGVAGLGMTYHVFDCVDGNMARTRGEASRFGAWIDGVFDMGFWVLLLVSLGVLVDHAGGGVLGRHALPTGMALALVVLVNRLARDQYQMVFADTTYFKSEIPERLSWQEWALISLVGLEFVYVIAILIGGALGVLDWVLVGIGVYVVLIAIGALGLTLSNAWKAGRPTPGGDP